MLFLFQTKPYEVYQLFKDYGDIVEVISEPNYTKTSIVFFKIGSSFDDQLKTTRTFIIDEIKFVVHNIRVKLLPTWMTDYRDESLDQIPSTHTPDCPNNILNALDDDCLRIIFKALDMTSLCSVANACERFYEVAEDIFKVRYSNQPFDFNRFDEHGKPLLLQEAELFLSTFGHHMTTISINTMDSRTIFAMVTDYCDELDGLSIRDSTMSQTTWREFQPVMRRIKHLETTMHAFTRYEQFDGTFDELKTLIVDFVEICDIGELLGFRFPKLESLELHNPLPISAAAYDTFLLQHRSVRSLIVNASDVHPALLQTTAKHLPHLKAFKLQANKCVISPQGLNWSHMQALKVLEFAGNTLAAAHFVIESLQENHVPLEELRLALTRLDQKTFDLIAGLKHLEKLELTAFEHKHVTDQRLRELAKELPHLKELNIESDYISIRGIRKLAERIEMGLVFRGKLTVGPVKLTRRECLDFTMHDCDTVDRVLGDRLQFILRVLPGSVSVLSIFSIFFSNL